MPHKTPGQSADKKQSHDPREPDDFKEGDRTSQVGRRGEHEDIEESRTKSNRGDVDDDLEDVVDLDATPSGDGPDA